MKTPQLESQRLEIIARQGDERLRQEIADVQGQIPATPPPTTSANISNLIDDSDFSWSTDAYTTPGVSPGDPGDPNNSAYNWYWLRSADTLLVADDAHSVKGPLHSTPDSAGHPKWNKINGWAEIGQASGNAYDIACPLADTTNCPRADTAARSHL